MQRRAILLNLASGIMAGFIALPAVALDFAEAIVRQLTAEGYGAIETSQTLLGRTRIVAEGPAATREIVLDPRTGEILRDLWMPKPGADVANTPLLSSGGTTSGTSGSSGSGSNSGSGSSGSGSSGSGSSGSGSNSGSGSSGSGSSGSGSSGSGSNSGSGSSGSNSGSGSSGSNSGSGGSGHSGGSDDDGSDG